MDNIFDGKQRIYKSIYKGIVIQNDDPLQGGRVKVFVPYIHFSLIGLSEETSSKDVSLNSFGTNINKENSSSKIDLTEHIETLKTKIGWAPVLQPITGETGFAKYNSRTKTSTVSDSNYPESTDMDGVSFTKQGPGSIYGKDSNVWGDPSISGGDRVDGNSGTYNPNKPTNMPKGTFTVPSVNTQVYVMFVDGDPFAPMVIGVAPTAYEFQAYANPSTYPSTYENTANPSRS